LHAHLTFLALARAIDSPDFAGDALHRRKPRLVSARPTLRTTPMRRLPDDRTPIDRDDRTQRQDETAGSLRECAD
jgi:hypothetical protein